MKIKNKIKILIYIWMNLEIIEKKVIKITKNSIINKDFKDFWINLGYLIYKIRNGIAIKVYKQT